MSKLKDSRDELTVYLEREDLAAKITENPAPLIQLMTNWHEAYKEFERGDTDFYQIWRERRMFVRSIGESDTCYPTLQVKKLDYDKWTAKKWDHAADDIDTSVIAGVAYNTGKAGILKRTNPKNFLTPPEETGGIKTKFSEGLLDLSGTILRPDREISQQLHNKPKPGNWVCFVPLSEEEDQALLIFLKDKLGQLQIILGKSDSNLNLVINKYKRICAKVTRLKLAFETDMALGFVAIPNRDGTYSKYKYVVKTEVKYSMNRTDGLQSTKIRMGNDLMTMLRNNVKRYKSVVGTAIKNEVRISIRRHVSGNWPLFAKWDGDTEHNGIWDVCTQLDGSSAWVETGDQITNTRLV